MGISALRISNSFHNSILNNDLPPVWSLMAFPRRSMIPAVPFRESRHFRQTDVESHTNGALEKGRALCAIGANECSTGQPATDKEAPMVHVFHVDGATIQPSRDIECNNDSRLGICTGRMREEVLRVDCRRRRRRSTTIRRFHVNYHPASVCHRCG